MMFWDLLLSAKVKDFFSFWILIRSRGGIEEKTPWTDSQKCETPEAQKSHYIFLFRVTGHRKHGLNTTQHIHKYNIRMYSNYTWRVRSTILPPDLFLDKRVLTSGMFVQFEQMDNLKTVFQWKMRIQRSGILTLVHVHGSILQQGKVLNKGTFMILTVHVLPNQWCLSETRPMVFISNCEISPCPGGETCWELSILWLGSILETLALAIVTPHPAHPPTPREKEQFLLLTNHSGLTISHRSSQSRGGHRKCLPLNTKDIKAPNWPTQALHPTLLMHMLSAAWELG